VDTDGLSDSVKAGSSWLTKQLSPVWHL